MLDVRKENSSLVREQDMKQVLEMLRIALPSLSKVDDKVLITAIAYAKHLGLDPLKKEVHFVPFYDKEQGKTIVQPVVAYTEYIKRAERSGKLKGWTCKVVKQGDEYVAIVEIKRADWEIPFVWEVPLSEVKRETPLWKSQPLFMLRKTAIAQAFRMCFPEETAHLPYEEAESWIETEVEEEEPITEKQRKYLWAKAKEVGLTKEEVKEIIGKMGYESTKDIPQSKFDEVLYALEEFAQKK